MTHYLITTVDLKCSEGKALRSSSSSNLATVHHVFAKGIFFLLIKNSASSNTSVIKKAHALLKHSKMALLQTTYS